MYIYLSIICFVNCTHFIDKLYKREYFRKFNTFVYLYTIYIYTTNVIKHTISLNQLRLKVIQFTTHPGLDIWYEVSNERYYI